MDLRFLYFPTSLQVKRLAPKGKKMRMDHPFILGFCQNITFYIVFIMISHLFRKNKTFLNYCHILLILYISDSKMGDPRLLLFQNRTLVSKLELYPKGISIHILSVALYVGCTIDIRVWSRTQSFIFQMRVWGSAMSEKETHKY